MALPTAALSELEQAASRNGYPADPLEKGDWLLLRSLGHVTSFSPPVTVRRDSFVRRRDRGPRSRISTMGAASLSRDLQPVTANPTELFSTYCRRPERMGVLPFRLEVSFSHMTGSQLIQRGINPRQFASVYSCWWPSASDW